VTKYICKVCGLGVGLWHSSAVSAGVWKHFNSGTTGKVACGKAVPVKIELVSPEKDSGIYAWDGLSWSQSVSRKDCQCRECGRKVAAGSLVYRPIGNVKTRYERSCCKPARAKTLFS